VIETTEVPAALQAELDTDFGPMARDFDPNRFELVPWAGRFLVKQFPREEFSEKGLKLPEQCQEDKNWGRVIRLPEINPPEGVKVGDIVMFIKDSGQPVDAFGKGYILLQWHGEYENDLIGIIRKREPLDGKSKEV
jgi:co-chaperonin GroES (HSP10)